MRRLIVCNMISLDGYYEGPNKNVMDLFSYRLEEYPDDESFDVYNAERLRDAGSLLLGRTTYEGFRGYWPAVAEVPTATEITREISRMNIAIEKVVISNSLTPENTEPWQKTTRIIKRDQANLQITDLKKQSGKDILVFGSRILWNALLADSLVDELHLMISPVLLGSGTPVFQSNEHPVLQLIETRTWDKSGNVLSKYKVLT